MTILPLTAAHHLQTRSCAGKTSPQSLVGVRQHLTLVSMEVLWDRPSSSPKIATGSGPLASAGKIQSTLILAFLITTASFRTGWMCIKILTYQSRSSRRRSIGVCRVLTVMSRGEIVSHRDAVTIRLPPLLQVRLRQGSDELLYKYRAFLL